MELKHTISKFVYRIEAKPDGGFIARSSDPAVPTIEGATRAEVEQKVQASISAELGVQFPALKRIFESQGIKTAYHIEAKPGGGFAVKSSDPSHEPIEAASLEKIEHLINSKFVSYLLTKLPADISQQLTTQLGSGGVNVILNREVTVTTNNGTRTLFSSLSTPLSSQPTSTPFLESGEFPSPSGGTTDGSPVTRYETGGLGRFFKLLLAVLALAAILYFVLHR